VSNKCAEVDISFDDQRVNEMFETLGRRYEFKSHFGDQDSNSNTGKVKAAIASWTKKNPKKPLTQKQIDHWIKKIVKPGEGEQTRLALEITSRIDANQNIMKLMRYQINDRLNLYSQENVYGKIEWLDTPDGERVAKLETIPLPALRDIMGDLERVLNGGRQFKDRRGIFGNLAYEWGSPKQEMLKDKSGLMFDINENTEQFTHTALAYGNQYLYKPQDKEGQAIRNYGFMQLGSEISTFERYTMKLPDGVGWRLYSMYMDGRVKIDAKSGAIFMAKEEVKKPDGWEWSKHGSFTYGQNKDKMLRSLNKEQYDEFMFITKRSRALFNQFGEDVVSEINDVSELESDLKQEAKDQGDLDWIERILGPLIDTDLAIAGLNFAELKKRDYYPRSYFNGTLAANLMDSMDGQELALKDKRRLIKSNPKMSRVKRAAIVDEIIDHETSLQYIDGQLGMMFNEKTAIDPHTNNPARTQQWYENFKHLSRIMDPDMVRYDKDVTTDYINEVSTAITRNYAIINVGKALLKAKREGVNENTLNASIDIFKSTFYQEDAASQFMGKDLRAKTISHQLSKVGVNVSPGRLTQHFNNLSTTTTIATLWSPMQGILNWSAELLKMDHMGRDMMLESTAIMADPQDRETWKGLIAASGINTFSEFVGTYFSKSLRPAEMNAYKKEIDHFNKLIEKSEKTGNVKDIIKYNNYVKKTKSKVFSNKMNEVAQYIITRNTTYYKEMGSIAKAFGVAASYLKVLPSINQTEQMLRSESFIIGALASVRNGHAKSIHDPIAIEAGVLMTMSLDFGLSHQHVGAALRGPIAGNFINKMKIWHNQKNGFDYRKYRDAIYAMTPNLEISDGKIWKKTKNAARLTKSTARLLANNPGNIALAAGLAFSGAGLGAAGATLGGIAVGVTKTMYKNRAKGLRLVAPTVAGFDSWYVRAALITGLMDLSFFAPGTTMFANSVVKSRFLASPMSKGVMGMGSSLISLGLSGFAVAKAILNGDEEDVIEQYIPKMLLASPMGIGATSMFAAGRLGYNTIYNPEKYQYDNINYWQDDARRIGSSYLSAPVYAGAKGTWRFIQKEWDEYRY
jgi:hypothetical protein